MAKTRRSGVYYTRDVDGGGHTAREKATGVKNNFGADIFRFDGAAYDGVTGGTLCGADSLPALLKKHDGKPDEWDADITRLRERGGLNPSPRYTRLDEKKSDIFPSPAKDGIHILSPSIYDKGKSWFTRVYDDNGVELYAMDKDKSSIPTLFAPCRGWMVGIGAGAENVVAFLTQDGFDLYDYLVAHYEQALLEPNKWADVAIADFLGRRGEADAHNAPIREARKAARSAESEAKAEHDRLRAEEIRAKYEAAIMQAEQAILEKRTVQNDDIVDPNITWTERESKSLILELFRENGITLPLKTQGWVKSALAEICYYPDSGDWGYRYYKAKGCESTVFAGYVNKLAAAVEKKYRDEQDETEDCRDFDDEDEEDFEV